MHALKRRRCATVLAVLRRRRRRTTRGAAVTGNSRRWSSCRWRSRQSSTRRAAARLAARRDRTRDLAVGGGVLRRRVADDWSCAGLAAGVGVADPVLGAHDPAHAADAGRGAAADVRPAAAGVDVGVRPQAGAKRSPMRSAGLGRSRAWHALTAPLTVFLLQAVRAVGLAHPVALRGGAAQRCHPRVRARLPGARGLAVLVGDGARPLRPAGYGLGVLYVFLTAVHSSALGALLTVAPSVWYGEYGRRPRPGTSTRWRTSSSPGC